MALAGLAWEIIPCHLCCVLLVTSELQGHLRFKGQGHRRLGRSVKRFAGLFETALEDVDELVLPCVTPWSLLTTLRKKPKGS